MKDLGCLGSNKLRHTTKPHKMAYDYLKVYWSPYLKKDSRLNQDTLEELKTYYPETVFQEEDPKLNLVWKDSYEGRASMSFEKYRGVKVRYDTWLRLHNSIITTLQKHLIDKGVCDAENQGRVRAFLLCLWSILPPEGPKSFSENYRRREPIIPIKPSQQQDIDGFLTHLVSNWDLVSRDPGRWRPTVTRHLCSHDRDAHHRCDRFQCYEDIPVKYITQCGAMKHLLKHGLLQTPLRYWPELLGISELNQNKWEMGEFMIDFTPGSRKISIPLSSNQNGSLSSSQKIRKHEFDISDKFYNRLLLRP